MPNQWRRWISREILRNFGDKVVLLGEVPQDSTVFHSLPGWHLLIGALTR
jgi:hypothetical protein